MSNVELVIKLDEDTYNVFKNLNQIIGILAFEKDTRALIKAAKNGVILPKGHGKLIDGDELKTVMSSYMLDKNKTHEAKYVMSVAKGIVDLQNTIIEADK